MKFLALLALAAILRTNPRDGQAYVWIPAGTYLMGCSSGDSECFAWEMKPPRVTIAKGFRIGQTEVTQRAYRRVMGKNPSLYRGDDLPVDQVGWNEARDYCGAVGMRLPTEEEWEYAARGGDRSARYGELKSIGWFDANAGNKTHPVAQKSPNAFGLYDMPGNTWEWVEDTYEIERNKKILRGGSFYNLRREIRVTNRLWATPDTNHRNMGMRCAGN